MDSASSASFIKLQSNFIMKFVSFKIIILCILLPPVFYIFTVQSLERHYKSQFADEIQSIYTGDTAPLLNGSIALKDAINNNIDRYLKGKAAISWGVTAKVTVTTKEGTILYPAVYVDEGDSFIQSDPMQVAADNYKLMNEGLVVSVDLKLEHNTKLSNAILAFYIVLSVLALYFYYRAGLDRAKQEDMIKNSEIERLLKNQKEHLDNLQVLEQEREKLTSEMVKIKRLLEDEKIKASKNEDEMIQEIVTLEEKLGHNLALQQESEEEMQTLKEKIKRFEKGRRRQKGAANIRKRFKTLYKNISLHDRAVGGFIDLEDDLKIKSEEIIHNLNQDPKLVPVKRKVFGKKSRQTVQEVIFAYKGRLYFRQTKGKRIEVLAIGTKNTQAKDLGFLDNL